MKPEINQELIELESFIGFRHYTNETLDEAYKQALSRIRTLKNPKIGYYLERRAAMHRYLSVRTSGAKKSYLDWARSNALDALSSIKLKYAGLV